MKSRLLVLAVAAIIIGSASLRAQFVWTGAGGNNDVANAGNWSGGVAPTGSGTDDLLFNVAGTYSPSFNAPISIRSITLGPSAGFFNLSGSGQVTLTGDITTAAGTNGAMLTGMPITLAAGTHTITLGGIEVSGADVYLFSQIDGSGDIVKYGTNSLVFDHAGNTFTGSIDLVEGAIRVHGDGALGTGLLKMDGGTLIAVDYYNDNHITTLYNSLSLGDQSNFGTYGNKGSITFTGATTLRGGTTTANISYYGYGLLTLNGIGETDAGTVLSFDGEGQVRITGTNTYTGGTQVYYNNSVVFAAGAPSAGLLQAYDDGYIGTEVTTNMQAGFIDHFDKVNSVGILGFDSPDINNPQDFTENIDLTGFDSNVRLGTSTSARLSGTITPQDTAYQFGGRGTLTVTSNLGGIGRNLTASNGILLKLTGSNTYDSGTYAYSGGAIVFDGATALPTGGTLGNEFSGYIGYTENTGLSAATFLNFFDVDGTYGVLGFDAANPLAGRTVSDSIDLTYFDPSVFIGTATNVTLTGTITPPDSQYRFTGFRDGRLTVDSLLTGSNSAVIGLDGESLYPYSPVGTTYAPSVTLNGNNTYTGGTTLQSGTLILGNANALGTGPLTVNAYGPPAGLQTTADLVIANDIDFGSANDFKLGGQSDFTLAGNLTSSFGVIDKTDLNTITLSGNNTGLVLDFNVVSGKIIFGSDTAAGTGQIFLRNLDGVNDGQIAFTSATPSIGSLYGESNTRIDLGSGTLTINQDSDQNFDGTISGSGGITKAGASKLVLTGTNTYTGATTLKAGTLVATNASSLGAGGIVFDGGRLSVDPGVILANPISFGASGGTLGGNGTFSGHVDIGTGAHLGPGNSVGLLTFTGGINWAPGGIYDIEVQGATGARGTGYDSIDVTGGLTFTATLGSPFTLNLISLNAGGTAGAVTDFNSSNGYAWLIAHTDGLTGFNPANVLIDTSNFANSLGSGAFNVSTSGNDIYLNFSPVPEPSTYALLGLGLGTLALGLRRRVRR